MTDEIDKAVERLTKLDALASPAPWKSDSYEAVRGTCGMLIGFDERHLGTIFGKDGEPGMTDKEIWSNLDLIVAMRNNLRALLAEVARLQEEKRGLAEALRFYANRDLWKDGNATRKCTIELDGGAKASAALTGERE